MWECLFTVVRLEPFLLKGGATQAVEIFFPSCRVWLKWSSHCAEIFCLDRKSRLFLQGGFFVCFVFHFSVCACSFWGAGFSKSSLEGMETHSHVIIRSGSPQ